MNVEKFQSLISQVTAQIAGKPLDKTLEAFLNEQVPADGELFKCIESSWHQAVKDGWMCAREHGGIKFGRVIKAGETTQGFSVDVVEMDQLIGPHHAHPNGEIDMIMPLEGEARFDGYEKGWLVYPPGSAHRPTVSGGRAYVLYLLPDGAIEFTRT
jgi:hypothetical protein